MGSFLPSLGIGNGRNLEGCFLCSVHFFFFWVNWKEPLWFTGFRDNPPMVTFLRDKPPGYFAVSSHPVSMTKLKEEQVIEKRKKVIRH